MGQAFLELKWLRFFGDDVDANKRIGTKIKIKKVFDILHKKNLRDAFFKVKDAF